jgi:hypothetical protein
MPVHERSPEPAASPPAVAPPAAAKAALANAATPAGVLALQRAAGNAAVGRLLARQPAVKPLGRDDLMDPFERTPEELAEMEAAVAQAKVDLREHALEKLEKSNGLGFIIGLRYLQPGQRGILLDDAEFWKRVRARLSGLALWSVQIALQHGSRSPEEVNALHTAVHEGNWLRARNLIMAYPDLKQLVGLREVVAHRFPVKQAEDLAAVIAEGGTRAEAGVRAYQEVHYEAGVLKQFTGTRNYELVRLGTQLRVIVKIRLQNDPANAKDVITDKVIARWEEGIKRRWNGKFRLRNKGKTLDVWFLPIFVFHDPAAHHGVTVKPEEPTVSNEHLWHEDDSADTAAHEFGHMIGNPDEYNLPGSMAEIPAALGLTDAEKRRSSWEGLTGKKAKQSDEGHDMENLMGAHYKNASVRARHGWDVLEVFNARLRLAGEDPWTIELK